MLPVTAGFPRSCQADPSHPYNELGAKVKKRLDVNVPAAVIDIDAFVTWLRELMPVGALMSKRGAACLLSAQTSLVSVLPTAPPKRNVLGAVAKNAVPFVVAPAMTALVRAAGAIAAAVGS